MSVVQTLVREGREWLTLRKDCDPAPGGGRYMFAPPPPPPLPPPVGVGGGTSTLTLRAYISPKVRWNLLPLESHEGEDGDEGGSSSTSEVPEDEDVVEM